MKVLALAMLATCALHADPKLSYTKSFPGSVPAYLEIALAKDCTVVYKEAVDDPDHIDVKLPQSDCATMFDLAEKLDHFTRPIESKLKVAFMGKKTFRFEDGASHEVQFNYSEDPNAQALLDRFEKIAESERIFIELERRVKFDKLGVNDALIQMQVAWNAQRLIAPEQFLPLLRRVANNEVYLRIARARAAELIETLLAGTAAGSETGNK